MGNSITANLLEILACPYCGSKLDISGNVMECSSCDEKYYCTNEGQFDLRLQKIKTISYNFKLERNVFQIEEFDLTPLRINKNPEVDFSSVKIPWHITKEIMSYFPGARSKDSLMLDLGCGNVIHKSICEHAGFKYVGIDYSSREAPLLADAQALPFKANSFEFILSIAVLEHIQYPLIMMSEAFRVMKSGGVFIGTVAFLEPFHSNSYYHHSHLGLINSLQYAGFKIKKVSPSKDWSVLYAQAIMSLFPKLSPKVCRIVIWPLFIIHRFWWKVKRLNENKRILLSSAAFSFIAYKE